MGEVTGISWCDHTFNPWEGCTKISPGCDLCYAAARDERYHAGENWGKDAARLQHTARYWNQPLRWNAAAIDAGERRRVFCGSLMDIMEDRRDLDASRDAVFELIDRCTALDWLLVTKRPQCFRRLLPSAWRAGAPTNVWCIVTVESSDYLWRVAHLMDYPFHIRGISYEPALERVDFSPWLGFPAGVDWLIIGGESSQLASQARSFQIAWAREAIKACRDAKAAAPFLKQLGSNAVDNQMRFITRHRAGADPEEWPEDVRVQEFPVGRWLRGAVPARGRE